MIFSRCSSVILKPAPTIIFPLLSLISFAIYLPIMSSLFIEIDFRPFSFNLLAIIKFSLSPLDKIFLLFLESTKSKESLIGLL